MPTPTDAYSDVRLIQAGEKAEILHRRAWDWCGHQETDGVIPKVMLAQLCPVGWKARLKALLDAGVWMELDGDRYKLAGWDEIVGEMRSLARRRDADRERQQRHRDRQRGGSRPPERDTNRDENVDASRQVSRDNPMAEEKRKNPPTPHTVGGDCDPISKPHRRCRGCGTTKRAEVQTAAAEAIAADEQRRQAAKDAAWCGDPNCDQHSRWRSTDQGLVRCPDCHPMSILARTEPVQLALAATA